MELGVEGKWVVGGEETAGQEEGGMQENPQRRPGREWIWRTRTFPKRTFKSFCCGVCSIISLPHLSLPKHLPCPACSRNVYMRSFVWSVLIYNYLSIYHIALILSSHVLPRIILLIDTLHQFS